VVDHIEPFGGDREMMFDADNLQTLCKRCHDRDKQRVERRHPAGTVRRHWLEYLRSEMADHHAAEHVANFAAMLPPGVQALLE